MIAESCAPPTARSLVHDFCMTIYGFPPSDSDSSMNSLLNSPGLRKLAEDTKTMCAVRKPFVLHSERYIPQVQPHKTFEASVTMFPRQTHDYYVKVADVATSAAVTWLGIPLQDFHTRIRTYLTHVLIKFLGPASLLLPEAWDLYEELPIWLLDDCYDHFRDAVSCKSFDPAMMSMFVEKLETLAANRTEREHSVLAEIHSMYKTRMLTSLVRSINPKSIVVLF